MTAPLLKHRAVKIGTPVTSDLGDVYANFDFFTLLVFELGSCMGQTDRQTDGRTDKTQKCGLLGRPRNKAHIAVS